ncbi:glycosyltransferase family 8 protein [Bacteroides sp.]
MNIIYSCNDTYVPHTGISIISLLENNRKTNEITIYIVSKNISPSNIVTLQNIVESYNRELIIINFDDICYDLNISAMGRHIETIYSKAFFSRISGLDKAIYLDSDTVVIGDLTKLWEMSLENVYMGVVETISVKHKKKLGLSEKIPFFNDGVAVVNVDFCRKNNLIEKVLEVVDCYNGNPPVLSEGVLNVVCQNKVKYISLRYNLMSGILYFYLRDKNYLLKKLSYTPEDVAEACQNPIIIHYLSAFYNRPWFEKCTHPLKGYYYKYKVMSPWRNTTLLKGKLPFKLRLIDKYIQIFGFHFFN